MRHVLARFCFMQYKSAGYTLYNNKTIFYVNKASSLAGLYINFPESLLRNSVMKVKGFIFEYNIRTLKNNC